MRPVFLFFFYFHLSYLHLRSELVLLQASLLNELRDESMKKTLSRIEGETVCKCFDDQGQRLLWKAKNRHYAPLLCIHFFSCLPFPSIFQALPRSF